MPPTLLDDETSTRATAGMASNTAQACSLVAAKTTTRTILQARHPPLVIPSSRDRGMIAQARIAMFEKSRPTIQGHHVPPSVAVEPKTELPMKAKRSSFPILVK